jgi:hypothetical protein
MSDKINLVNITDLTTSLKIHEPKPNTQGGQTIKLTTEDKCKIHFVTPLVKIIKIGDYFIEAEVTDEHFLTEIQTVDDLILNTAAEKSAEWFNKVLDVAQVTPLFKSCVCDSILKIRYSDKDCTLFDNNKNLVPLSNLKENNYCKILIELNSIVFKPKEFTCSLKTLQIRTMKHSDDFTEFAFVDDD